MAYPKMNPPLIAILGIDESIGKYVRQAVSFTQRVAVGTNPEINTDLQQVSPASGVIFHSDNILADREAAYVRAVRLEIGNNSPMTLMVSNEPSDEVKAFCKEQRITRIQVYQNPDALDFLAEAMYLIATHKFRNTDTGDVV